MKTSFFKSLLVVLSSFCLVFLELAHAERMSEFLAVEKLLANSPANEGAYHERGQLSAGVFEHARTLAARPSLGSLDSWRRLANYPYAYPELRALASEVVERLRNFPRLTHILEEPWDRADANVSHAMESRERVLNAINALAGFRDGRACKPLVSALGRARDFVIVRELLWALARQQHCAEAAPLVLDIYGKHAHPELRLAAAQALSVAAEFDPKIVATLEARATEVDDIPEARAIAQGLARQCRLALSTVRVL